MPSLPMGRILGAPRALSGPMRACSGETHGGALTNASSKRRTSLTGPCAPRRSARDFDISDRARRPHAQRVTAGIHCLFRFGASQSESVFASGPPPLAGLSQSWLSVRLPPVTDALEFTERQPLEVVSKRASQAFRGPRGSKIDFTGEADSEHALFSLLRGLGAPKSPSPGYHPTLGVRSLLGPF